MKRFVYGLTILAALASPARAVSCGEGVPIIEEMSATLDLSEAERSKVKALIEKAKAENQQGRERDCKFAAAEAIRFLLVKTLIDSTPALTLRAPGL